jgi:hypothetical protein
LGEQKSNLHAQGVIVVKHRTRVGLKINDMREAFAEKMGIPAENIWFQ